MFNINGDDLYIGIETDDEEFTLLGKEGFYDLVYQSDAVNSMGGGGFNTATTLGYKRKHCLNLKSGECIVDMSMEVKQDFVERTLTLSCTLSPNKDLKGKLVLFYKTPMKINISVRGGDRILTPRTLQRW
jgi:hypothetical protein